MVNKKPTDVKNGSQILQAHIQTLYDYDKIDRDKKQRLEDDLQDLRKEIESHYDD